MYTIGGGTLEAVTPEVITNKFSDWFKQIPARIPKTFIQKSPVL